MNSQRAWASRVSEWWDSWFAGLTWKGAALITVLCAINALRRSAPVLVPELVEEYAPGVAIAFITGLIYAFPIALAVVAVCNRVPRGTRRYYPVLVAAILLSSAIGVVIIEAIEAQLPYPMGNSVPGQSTWSIVLDWWPHLWPRHTLIAGLCSAVYVYFRRGEECAAAAYAAEQQRLELDQRMEEARLQVLQAQIEPHFLFNTLATVRRLYQTNRAAAASMLDNLMRYLTVALPQMRTAESTLGREMALAEAYLNIQRTRMGRRLSFAIDVAPALDDAKLPPMMLLTLTENAIKHGLNPLPEGGFIRISARVEAQELRVQVADSGQGFQRTSGSGTGLANIRARLAAVYGRTAQLSVAHNNPRGVTATIALPYATVSAAMAAPA
ncbi:MAG TPA: histidine kinase [Rhodanobacteraceae bacterium]|nr:histidine kinase [Rhodanobacteraceae bacterium]